jgi:hypothetical protein
MNAAWIRAAVGAAALAAASTAVAAGKTYQVTGPVVDVTPDAIVVTKGKEKWELARTPETKMSGDVKKGDKVTIEYTMTARSVEVKGGGKGTSK